MTMLIAQGFVFTSAQTREHCSVVHVFRGETSINVYIQLFHDPLMFVFCAWECSPLMMGR